MRLLTALGWATRDRLLYKNTPFISWPEPANIKILTLPGKRSPRDVHKYPLAGGPQGLLSQRPDQRGDRDHCGVAPVHSRHRRDHVHH